MTNSEATPEGLNYLGTIDDVVERYPWRFRYDSDRLNHSLAVQLLVGQPILLNDGYLVNCSMGRNAVMMEDNLLCFLIKEGFVRIMSRGGDRYGLHEMPEIMKDHIESFRLLVEGKIPGAPKWKDLRTRLKAIDNELRAKDNIIGWPSFDAGSGYRVLTLKLLGQGSTAESVGLGDTMRNATFREFLNRIADRLNEDTSGARTYWEQLAKEYADKPGVTNKPGAFVQALMNLANEMYHYNMGIMLSADRGERISVETQASEAFDDLLVSKDVLVENIPSLPTLEIPKIVTKAPPRRLVRVLRSDLDLDVAKAREQWINLRAQFEEKVGEVSEKEQEQLREAAKEYAVRLSEYLKTHIDYRTSERLFGHAVGNLITDPKKVATVWLEVLGQSIGVPYVGGLIGFATGYVISRFQNYGVGVVTKKFRVLALKNQILPPEVVRQSQQVINRIKGRRVPSAIEIDRSRAEQLAGRMDKFVP